jgi:hypothetical protein
MRRPWLRIPAKLVEREPCQRSRRSPSFNLLKPDLFQAFVSSALGRPQQQFSTLNRTKETHRSTRNACWMFTL